MPISLNCLDPINNIFISCLNAKKYIFIHFGFPINLFEFKNTDSCQLFKSKQSQICSNPFKCLFLLVNSSRYRDSCRVNSIPKSVNINRLLLSFAIYCQHFYEVTVNNSTFQFNVSFSLKSLLQIRTS